MDKSVRFLKNRAAVALTACVMAVPAPAVAQAVRERVSLNADWKFSLEQASPRVNTAGNGPRAQGIPPTAPDFDDARWRTVNIPHDYVIEQPFTRNFPDKPMIFTESSSAVSDRGIYVNDWTRAVVGNYTDFSQDWLNWVRRTEDAWRPIAENDYLAGAFVWTGFDYKGEPSPYGWPNIDSHFGILDMCGFPKDVYYYYKAYWGSQPTVHITPHWSWPGSESKPIQVLVFSNAPVVDLILNGVSLGRKACPRDGHALWTVLYAPGTLIARGYDVTGRLLATDRVTTAGKSYRIELRTDLPKLTANGEDESVIEATIVDAKDNFSPTASDAAKFAITGGAGLIAGTGNGDPNDHTPDASPLRDAFNGRLAAIARSTGKRGTITVTATGAGLRSANITVQFGQVAVP